MPDDITRDKCKALIENNKNAIEEQAVGPKLERALDICRSGTNGLHRKSSSWRNTGRPCRGLFPPAPVKVVLTSSSGSARSKPPEAPNIYIETVRSTPTSAHLRSSPGNWLLRLAAFIHEEKHGDTE
jgi:hypothetical protein